MSTPLRLLLTDLLDDPAARVAFDRDPEGFLADHGWDGLDGGDVHTALGALTHELPVDQAARLAPLVDGGSAFDGGGLGAAIAGLQAAAAAVDDLTVADGAEARDGVLDVLEDPAAGIDAGIDAGPRPARDPGPPDAEDASEGETEGPATGIDDLRFGDAPPMARAHDGEGPASSPRDEAADEPPDDHRAGHPAPAELFGVDPAASFDDHSSRDFYDPAEETSELDGTEEPEDGFPY
jgi:hypothetical protein